MTLPRPAAARSHAAHSEPARPRPTRRRKGGPQTHGKKRDGGATVAATRRARHRRKGPQLRVAGPPRSRTLPFLIASFLIVGTLVVGVASVQAVVSQGSFRMQELTRRNVELEGEFGRLKLRVAELSAPERIASEARRLGFHVPVGISPLPVKGTVPAADARSGLPVFSLKGALERGP